MSSRQRISSPTFRKLPCLVALICLSLAAGAAIAAERVYKWTDENGVVHFSASPPPSQEAEQVKLKAAPPQPEKPQPEGQLMAQSEQPDTRAEQRALIEENRKIRCQSGRSRVAQIEPRTRVFRQQADGTRTYLDDDERLELLAEAKQMIAENCDS